MISTLVVPFATLESAPNFGELIAAYAKEAGMAGMPPPKPHIETYRLLDKTGMLKTICAYLGQEVVGFIVILVNMSPHYGVKLAHMESFFVSRVHRSTGAAMRLLHHAEDLAREMGAVGLMCAAAIGGNLERVLSSRSNYSKTHVGFFRGFA